jgi:hypothetical protein
MRRLLCLIALLLLPACEDLLDVTVPCVGPPPNLEGLWALRGEGQRTGCADERLNGTITIATPTPLAVRQVFAGDHDVLSLATPVDGLSFEGYLSTHCSVSFDMVEASPDGPVEYRFTGDPDGFDGPEIERGTFTSQGPGTCETSGTFDVEVTPSRQIE